MEQQNNNIQQQSYDVIYFLDQGSGFDTCHGISGFLAAENPVEQNLSACGSQGHQEGLVRPEDGRTSNL